jgi:hypothetical protein
MAPRLRQTDQTPISLSSGVPLYNVNALSRPPGGYLYNQVRQGLHL